MSINDYRILTGARWRTQKGTAGTRKITRRVLIGGEIPKASIMTPDGKQVMFEYAIDEVADGLGMGTNEFTECVIRAYEREQQIFGMLAEIRGTLEEEKTT